MAQTQLSASLKEHPKLSETREFKIAYWAGGQMQHTKNLHRTEATESRVCVDLSNLNVWGVDQKNIKVRGKT